ncbi:enoyl-CoA hydratase family protein [Rhodococcus tukisamuensis]|uniref:Enoyl-CoA hydratase n=1 Tax=Rhodococcus tukisamuensis TaxID=168276 RepID=A0A1G6ZSL2_9NOCA|nr:enoyl-CoA hydratase family protein [Rhodococcus tukisamuensis]SDE04805.1 enoyl-CoA hydratase [Rhodococcus tukisamuensis]
MTIPETSAPYVRYEVVGGFATVTLDSPHNRNAISARLVGELRQALADAAADDGVRAVVLTHTGNTFCAGADLSEASASAADPAVAASQRTQGMVDLLRAFLELPKPIVARIDGHVRAGGMGIVGACDLVVAGPRSTFALTEVRLGLAASIISLTLLPRMDPRSVSRYFLTGEKFGTEEAARVGLITVAAQDAAASTAELLAELRKGSPQGLAESKAMVNAAVLADFDESADRMAAQSARLFGTPEAMEGMMAFLQKRPANWAVTG